ncbi:hypothetical protein FHP25_18655 [Vineibacter terrae]|uniref:Uncharacterized protein n=1 Tax=Vineibacter terrae TaxID=2586908 RepID=A0A5C8PL05_9HYPH|nr:hypothetical protein [Vineibacter terrae]TXL73948.1 hypothetical protein FHP25_18655 [Vineibacter terrae]
MQDKLRSAADRYLTTRAKMQSQCRPTIRCIRWSSCCISVALGLALVAAPVGFNSLLTLDGKAAVARGGGGGGGGGGSGNGNGNGAGSGNGVGNGNALGNADGSGAGHGAAVATANGAGNGRGAVAHSPGGRGPVSASNAQLASALGALNAAHASAQARSVAAPNSRVGTIAAYDKAMLSALSMPLSSRDPAIAGARRQLAAASNKTLTPAVVARVDSLLGLPPTDPNLGVTR